MALPELMGQQDDLIVAAGGSLADCKTASNHRRDSQHRQKLGGDLQPRDALRGSHPGQIPACVLVDGEMGELGAVFAPILEGTAGHRTVGPAIRQHFHDIHELFGMRIRQRLEQSRVDHAENGGVGADAEGEREHGHGGKGRRLAELPQGIAEVEEHGGGNAGGTNQVPSPGKKVTVFLQYLRGGHALTLDRPSFEGASHRFLGKLRRDRPKQLRSGGRTASRLDSRHPLLSYSNLLLPSPRTYRLPRTTA